MMMVMMMMMMMLHHHDDENAAPIGARGEAFVFGGGGASECARDMMILRAPSSYTQARILL